MTTLLLVKFLGFILMTIGFVMMPLGVRPMIRDNRIKYDRRVRRARIVLIPGIVIYGIAVMAQLPFSIAVALWLFALAGSFVYRMVQMYRTADPVHGRANGVAELTFGYIVVILSTMGGIIFAIRSFH